MTDHEKLQRLARLWEDFEGYLRAVTEDYRGTAWDNTEMEAGALESFEDTRREICEHLGIPYAPLDKIQERINLLVKSSQDTK